ncbi:MAG: hypothetical protein WCC87_07215 [Candidatus Korobacteraceae bacterium]
MKYAKPDIGAVIPAASAILGTKEKAGSLYPDAPLTHRTSFSRRVHTKQTNNYPRSAPGTERSGQFHPLG